MKKFIYSVLMIVFGSYFSSYSFGESGSLLSASLPPADQRFLDQAVTSGLAEVELARLALQKTSNPAVKELAQRMIENHTKSHNELTRLASQKGITLPTDLQARHETIIDKLSQASGEAFDKLYIRNQIKDHNLLVRMFNRQVHIGKDQDLKNFANRTLPTLQENTNLARSAKRQTED